MSASALCISSCKGKTVEDKKMSGFKRRSGQGMLTAYTRTEGFRSEDQMFFGQMGLVIEAGQQQEPSGQASTSLERNPTFADMVDKGNISARRNTITPRTEALCSNVGLQAQTDATPRTWGSAISESVLGTPRDVPPNSAQRGGAASSAGGDGGSIVPNTQLVRAQQQLTQELRRALAAEEAALGKADRARREAQSVQRQMAMQEASLKREALEAIGVLERKHRMDLEECRNVTADGVRAAEQRAEGDKDKFLERYRTEMLRVKELLGTELVAVQKERDMLKDEVDALNLRLSEEEEVSSDEDMADSPLKSVGKTPTSFNASFNGSFMSRKSSTSSRRASQTMMVELEAANLRLVGENERLKRAMEATEAEAKKNAAEAEDMKRAKEEAEGEAGELREAFARNEEEVRAMRDEQELIRNGKFELEQACRDLDAEMKRKDELMVQSLDLTKRCIDDRKAVYERLAAAHAELMTQKSVGMANGGYVDMSAIAAVAKELGTDFDVPDLAYIGLEKDVEDSRVDCCVCGKRLLDEEDLKSHMRNYHTQDIVESVRTASKDKRFNAAAHEVLNGTDNSEDEDDDGPPSPLKKGVAAIMAMKKMTRGAEKTAQAEKEKQERASKKIVYGSFNPG